MSSSIAFSVMPRVAVTASRSCRVRLRVASRIPRRAVCGVVTSTWRRVTRCRSAGSGIATSTTASSSAEATAASTAGAASARSSLHPTAPRPTGTKPPQSTPTASAAEPAAAPQDRPVRRSPSGSVACTVSTYQAWAGPLESARPTPLEPGGQREQPGLVRHRHHGERAEVERGRGHLDPAPAERVGERAGGEFERDHEHAVHRDDQADGGQIEAAVGHQQHHDRQV